MNDVVQMNFEEFDTKTMANEGVEIPINKPNGEFSGLYITVLGQDSESFTKIRDQQEKVRLRKMARLRGATDSLVDDGKDNDLEITVACSLSWRHENGKPMPFDIGQDHDQAKEFYKKYTVVYEQVRIGIFDRANFTKVSAT